jgi:hypothetical protein
VLAALLALKRPRLAFGALLPTPVIGLWVRFKLRRPAADATAVTVIGPVWLVAYAAGMWRGALLALAKKLRRGERG